MAGPKGASIPSWQQGAAQKEAPSDDTAMPEQSSSTELESKETLIEQARRFLQDESISDAPTDKKIAFLESKGLSNDDIHTVLGVSRNVEATADDDTATQSTETKQQPSSNKPPSEPISPPAQSSPASSPTPPSRDVPPIITYPEFLLHQSKPPLITFQNFLYTIYGAAGLAASIYGASEFLAKPMLESLNGARHEFSQTVQGNLKTLNEKLEERVSSIPPTVSKPKHIAEDESEGDNESVTSDPTELFHRDIATQTTVDLDTSASSQTPAGTEVQAESAAQKAIDNHLSRLQSISSQLSSVVTTEKYSDATQNYAKSRLSELHTYLDSLTYSSPSYLSSSLYGAYDDFTDVKKASSSGGEEEAIAAFKLEVRSVKGTLLSARNFPSGSGGLRAGSVAR
ncbi:peroxin 14/17 [Arthroderma uncinatum]|uniref:peroxin 14/17 n=1 Tax=Arthroderma uncinatum TaxID=74035 RepID=UPI00144AFA0A|nr:peroxin 14/17 [Arthroderma uncinatum]KAF3480517.1 peroxin 14/17 [Arthroderma uncinatum]